jgi:hypothetical protein
MMEDWNDGRLKEKKISGSDSPQMQYSTIPAFHHSGIESFHSSVLPFFRFPMIASAS